MQKRTKFLITFALVLGTYLGTYLYLSRRGYAEADRYGIKGLYYFPPQDTDAWKLKNYGCVFVFGPLNHAERFLGYGRPPASEPLWGLGE